MSGPEIPVELVAKFAHEVNRGYCASLGDQSQPPWELAPQWQKDSAKAGVLAILTGKVTTPAESHASWLKQKVDEGWVYGPTKNPDAKEHPCMVPYEDLPAAQRAKDYIFQAVVTTMMAEFDLVSVG